jgi:hypothetical protein
VRDLLGTVARTDGVGIICSLHQVPFASSYADPILGLSHGRVAIDVPVGGFDPAAFERLYGPQDAAFKSFNINGLSAGGRGGIRTHGGLPPTAVFKTAALNHSATLPHLTE